MVYEISPVVPRPKEALKSKPWMSRSLHSVPAQMSVFHRNYRPYSRAFIPVMFHYPVWILTSAGKVLLKSSASPARACDFSIG